MRSQIILDNPTMREQDLWPFVTDNPFIPQKRAVIFLKGIFAGLKGDFLTSSHLLIPQLEDALRQLLVLHGVIVSSIDNESIQKEYSLNILLEMPQMEQILGKDLVFDLQGLLTEQHGNNLRNLASHGLVDYEEFFSPECIYLWWVTIRLCVLALINDMWLKTDNETNPDKNPDPLGN